MKKFWSVLCVLSLLAGMFCGCASGSGDQLSDSLRREILDLYPGKEFPYDDEDTVAGWRYYGTYNGYAVLMDAGMLAVVTCKEIGGREFKWGSGSLLLKTYKDGQMLDLEEVYGAGGITERDLDKILQKHKEHFAESHHWDYDAD